jgi:hypothetical protein
MITYVGYKKKSLCLFLTMPFRNDHGSWFILNYMFHDYMSLYCILKERMEKKQSYDS